MESNHHRISTVGRFSRPLLHHAAYPPFVQFIVLLRRLNIILLNIFIHFRIDNNTEFWHFRTVSNTLYSATTNISCRHVINLSFIRNQCTQYKRCNSKLLKSFLNNLIGLIPFIISVPFKSHDTGIDRKAKTKRTIPVEPKKKFQAICNWCKIN